jgi:transposase
MRGLLYRRQQQWANISESWQSDKNSHIGNVSPERSYPVQLLLSNIYHQPYSDKWYVSFTIKADKIPPLYHEVSEPTGIDLGVSTFATLSDGTVYQLPDSLKTAKIKLGKLQYRNRNKQLGNRKLGIKASKNAQKFIASRLKNTPILLRGDEISCRKQRQKSVRSMLTSASKI